MNHESNLLLLCPNCHWEFDNKNELFDVSLIKPKQPIPNNRVCPHCGKPFYSKKPQKYCSTRCTSQAYAKIRKKQKKEIVTAIELHKLVWSMSCPHVGKKIKCSKSCVHDMCKRLAVPLPGHNFWQKLTANKFEYQTCPLPKY